MTASRATPSSAALARTLAGWWPWAVETDADLDRALAYLGLGVDAATVERGARALATGLFVVALLAGAALGAAGTTPYISALASAVALGSGAALGTLVVARRGPPFVATLARTRALGEAAGLVSRAALRLRVDPTVERAAAFAARTGTGPLARSLGSHVERAAGTGRTGLAGFVAEWGERFPALDRAVSRLDSAAAAPAEKRDRHLDRAVDAALDGVADELAAFAGEIRGPVTGLYAFGVLLPLALVGVLPAARVAGVRVSLPAVVGVYDLLLPVVVTATGAWLLARRPVAFPPPDVGRDHPDVPDTPIRAVGAGGLAAVAGFLLVDRAVAAWAAPVAAAGLGPGVALVVCFRPARRVHDRVTAVESNLDDALYLVGRRVEAGAAVESAIETAAESVPGATGRLLADAAARQRRLSVTVRTAFLGDSGALGDLPSPRTRETATLFALAATEGEPAGHALVTLADHVERLQRIERTARRDLSRVTDTLANTAAVFGPLVGGATVALSARVAATGTTRFGADALPTAALGVAVGAYVLWLAVALTALSTGLTHGLDRVRVGYRTGLALCLATCSYLAAYVGAGLLL
ncbi:MAG: type II secretion system protein [Haloplanus sp.]